MEEDMFQHMHRKEFDNVDELPNTNYGNSYHIISLKDTDFIMLMMTTYGTLDNLEGLETQRRYKGSVGGGGDIYF